VTDILLHTCCGPCSTVAVPAWRARGVEPLAWFCNPNIQPAAELGRRRESMRRYSRAAGLELLVADEPARPEAWAAWAAGLAEMTAEERCRTCLGLRLDDAGAAAARFGIPRFSTSLSVSPYQRHDLIVAAGDAAARRHGAAFVYLDLRADFRDSYAESRRLELYRQPYCGCVASKWEAWQERRRRRAG
jgi:predicted adenine nucleotide alpha hydrolase (AANH) superfamily ATPase